MSSSQNARGRKAAPPRKPNKRRNSDSSSSLDLSSDGGYSALDEVSSDDNDDDENDVYAAEEEAIINDVTKFRHARTPRPSVQQKEDEDAGEEEDNDADDDDDDDEDEDDEDDLPEIPVNDEDEFSSGPDDKADDSTSWNGIQESDANANANGSEQHSARRQVRFAGVSDSSESDSDTGNNSDNSDLAEFFPDVFVSQQSLDEGFRRQIEEESDSSNSSTFWDFTAPTNNNTLMDSMPVTDVADLVASEAAVATALGTTEPDAAPEEDSHSSDDLDGYESDGDTTEDDEPQLIQPRRKPSRHSHPVDSDTPDSESEQDVPLRTRRGHPRIGRFKVSSKHTKPIAVINSKTGKMVIFTPEPVRETEIMTDPIPLSLSFFPLEGSNMVRSSARPSGHYTNAYQFSDLADLADPPLPDNSIIHSDPTGPSAFYGGFHNMPLGIGFSEDSDNISAEFGEEPGESTLRIEDFICFDRNQEADAGGTTDAHAEPDATMLSSDAAFDAAFDAAAFDTLPAADMDAMISGLFSDGATLPDDPFMDMNFGLGMDTTMGSSSVVGGGDNNNNDDDDDVDGATPAETPTRATTPGGAGATSSRRTSVSAATTTAAAAADAAETPDSPPLHPLMAHFGKNADVGAFRRNQINQQLISSNKATAESLAFSGPLNLGTLRGIKNGSLGAVSAPLTPPRRPKRKAQDGTTMESAHKRYRSISEVQDLTL